MFWEGVQGPRADGVHYSCRDGRSSRCQNQGFASTISPVVRGLEGTPKRRFRPEVVGNMSAACDQGGREMMLPCECG